MKVGAALLVICLIGGLVTPASGGILGFWRWFQGHYKEAVTNVGPNAFSEFDHVLLDVNQLAHMAARKAQDEDHAIRRLLRDIARTLKVLRPHKSVVVAFDGPAPLAKIITQRKRRSSEKELSTPINSLHLSPGTAFMRRAADAIIDFCRTRLETDRRLRQVKFYVSGSESPGEGEVKLMDWINTFVKDKEESIIIVGGDADLVLQGLALPDLPDFNVYIPDVRRTGSVVSLRHLVGRLEKTFPGKAGGVRNDLVLLLIMSGNDYLPKIRGLTFRAKLEAYERVRRLPQFHDQYMLDRDKGTFNWPFLRAFFDDLASRTFVQDIHVVTKMGPTPAGLLHELSQKKVVPPFSIDFEGQGTEWTCRLSMEDRVYEIVEPMPSLKAAKHEVSRAVLLDIVPEIFDKYFNQKPEEEEEEEEMEEDEEEEDGLLFDEEEGEASQGEEGDEEEIVDWQHQSKHYDENLYLSGLLWNFQMYNDGYCPDYSFAYRHRFAPSVSSLATFIQQRLEEDPAFQLQAPISTLPPFHAALACLAVMPRWGLHLVPNNLSSVLLDNPRVDRMYDPGATFSLDLLVQAVTASRPRLVRTSHFYWNEVSLKWGKRANMQQQLSPQQRPQGGAAAVNATDASSRPDGNTKAGPVVTVRRVAATSSPPLRSWEKRVPPLPMIDLTVRKWKLHGSGGGGGGRRSYGGGKEGEGGVRWPTSRGEGEADKRRRKQRQHTLPKAAALMVLMRGAPTILAAPKAFF